MNQVLYRLYRPKTFDEVYGQDHIIPILKNQIATGNVGHAYLFTGPRGTGKTSTARIFATELNRGSDIDIIELDAASHNKVEDIREIIDRLALAPFEGKYKIYILDEVHMLSTAAANAFLKSLEEPPEHVIFIMATTEPNKLPATILSRTQRFDFNKITIEEIVKRLKVVLSEEKIAFSEEALDLIAKKSDGGLRDALSLLDKAISYGDLDPENVTKALGSVHSSHQLDLLRAIMDSDTSAVLILLDRIRASGLDPKVFLLDLIQFLRDLILFQNDVPRSSAEQLEEAASFMNDRQAAYILEELSKTLGQLRYSPDPDTQMMAEMVMLTNTKFENIEMYRRLPSIFKSELSAQELEIKQLHRKIRELEEKIANGIGFPQNSVGNSQNSVDNRNFSTNDKLQEQNEFSTYENMDEIIPANVEDVRQQTIDDEEKAALEKINEILPSLKQKLKEIRRMNIYSVLIMARPARFVNGNLFFVFEGENKSMMNIMRSTEPNRYVDPILSDLYGKPILTHYISEEELSDLKKDKWLELTQEIENTFPGSTLEVE
ncbi:MAG: DNA polymerase III subunit gamma/tau [Peptostreptococcaceae bacterium]|nr:DNA polymerase III subunit gamma/tau [Peptostreptococcaceae bacterium]